MSLVRIIQNILQKISDVMEEIDKSYFPPTRWVNKNFDKFVAEPVRRHIRLLNECKHLTLFEREQIPLYPIVRHDYEGSYCPPHLPYKALNRENREKYFWLRIEIDEALDDSAYIYNH